MKQTIKTMLIIVLALMITSSVYAEELTGVQVDDEGNYSLDLNSKYDDYNRVINHRLQGWKHKGYYKELSDEWIDENFTYLEGYFRLKHVADRAENELGVFLISKIDNPLSVEVFKHDFDTFLKDEGKNFYRSYERMNENGRYEKVVDDSDYQKLLALKFKYDLSQQDIVNYELSNYETSERVWKHAYESNSKNFTYNHFVLQYRVDDRIEEDKKIYLERYKRQTEEGIIKDKHQAYSLLALISGDLRSNFIVLRNENEDSFSMKEFKAVSGNNEYVFDLVIKAGEMLVIAAPSNTTTFPNIENYIELPEIFWENDDLTIFREDGEVLYHFID